MNTERRHATRSLHALRAAIGLAALALLVPGAAVALSGVQVLREEAEASRSIVVLPREQRVEPVLGARRRAPVARGVAKPGSAPASPAPDPSVAPASVIEGVLGRGDSLFSALRQNGVSPEAAQLVAREMKEHFDFRNARPGHSYRLARDFAGRVVDFRYQLSDTQSFRLALDGNSYRVSSERTDLLTRQVRIAGIVATTLYSAIRDLGETSQLAADFTEIFAWDIDFSRSSHHGDEFRILYERLYSLDPDGTEQYMGPGRILAAHYVGPGSDLTAVYFETVSK